MVYPLLLAFLPVAVNQNHLSLEDPGDHNPRSISVKAAEPE